MASAQGGSARTALRRISAPIVVAIQMVLGLFTLVLMLILGWEAAVVGLVLMQIVTTGAAVGPWGSKGATRPTWSTGLERRMDALSARVVASSERTRVEVLDALADVREAKDRTP